MRHLVLAIFLLRAATAPAPAGDLPAPGSDYRAAPNFLVILADDYGPDLMGAYRKILLEQRSKTYPDCASDPDCFPDPPCTPNLDKLASRGMLFSRAWSAPLCSPTRAMILTGKYGHQNGVGRNTDRQPSLRFTDPPLAWRLGDLGYRSAAIGKWHLQAVDRGFDYQVATQRHPVSPSDSRCPGIAEFVGAGFDIRLGSPMNLLQIVSTGMNEGSYRAWEKNVDGVPIAPYCKYATTDTIDDAIALLDPQIALSCASPGTLPCPAEEVEVPLCDDYDLTAGDTPWLLYVALNAPHTPFHLPDPNECPALPGDSCYECDNEFDPEDLGYQRARMMCEVMDAEIGRLLDRVDLDNTYVIFMGDNGTTAAAIAPQTRYNGDASDPCVGSRAKGTLYEGALHVPLVVAGPGIVPGGRCDALVGLVDVFATVLDLAGGAPQQGPSVSFVPYLWDPEHPPVREFIYAERFSSGFDPVCQKMPRQNRFTRAVRNERFKLIRTQRVGSADGCPPVDQVELFELESDPFEEFNLLDNPDKLENPTILPPATEEDYCELRCELVRMGVDRERPGETCNCCIGLDDLASVLSQLGCQDGCGVCTGDLDGDCDVDLTDLANVLANFGSCE